MKAIVSDKGGVTIPDALRRRLGIRPGDVLDLREQRGRLVATKEEAPDPVDEVYGILKLDQPTDRLIRVLRGTPDAV
jgi:AbrB family looped-hinge helix DNA binding protein